MNLLPFTPNAAGTVNLSVTASTGRVQLLVPGGSFPGGSQIMVTSPAGGTIAFINFGDASVTAVAATATPILPGSVTIFTVQTGPTVYAAAIGTSGTTLYFTVGQGS